MFANPDGYYFREKQKIARNWLEDNTKNTYQLTLAIFLIPPFAKSRINRKNFIAS